MRTPDRFVQLALLLLLWLSASAAVAATPVAKLRVGVATMLPGEIFWERFGHDAIVVDDPAQGPPLSYNFGFFNLDESGFFGRFIRGEMEYQLVALPLSEDMRYYQETGRGVSIQWLDLDDQQARQLASALAENAKPENARYRYDYFTDNCATRVRDALDRALGGTLRKQLESRSLGNTYRSESVRLASPALWMGLGFDVGLGPYADRPLSRWEDAFVPMQLADGLRQARRADGRKLVLREETLLPHRIAPEPLPQPQRWWPWLLAGIAVSAAVGLLERVTPRHALWVALPFWTLCTLLGALMLFIWVFTVHRAGWSNHNLLLFNPLCLLLWPGAIRMLRGRDPGRGFRLLLAAIAFAAALSAFLLWLPVQPQRNAPWISLLLPVHVALWWLLGRAGLVTARSRAQDARHG